MPRVMTVDDQEVFRSAARAVVDATPGFESAGEPCSGEEALGLVDAAKPELVLVDVRMPGLGGLETARELSARHPDLVVVLVSLDDPPEEAGGPGDPVRTQAGLRTRTPEAPSGRRTVRGRQRPRDARSFCAMAVRVVVAEDSFLVREGIQQLLDRRPTVEVVASCGDLDSLLEAIERERPDVVLTDIRMPPTRTDEGIRSPPSCGDPSRRSA